MKLLAHELTHTAQQKGNEGFTSALKIADPDGPAEKEAESRAGSVQQDRPSAVSESTPVEVARQPVRDPSIPLCPVAADCSKKIPGSSFDFSHAVDETQSKTAKELTADPVKAAAAGKARTAAYLTIFANQQSPGLLNGLGIVVNPAIGDTAGAQFGECAGMSPPASPSAHCIEVPDALERQAMEFFFVPGAPTIAGVSRGKWEMEALTTLTHEVEHGRFDKSPAAGITARDNVSMFELGELNSILSEFPVMYRKTMAIQGKDKEEAKRSFIRNWIVDYILHDSENIRGILTKLRCLNPCDKVEASVKAVFLAQASGWTVEERNLMLSFLTDPAMRLNWPMPPPPPTFTFPVPEHPKQGPLYRPRGSFDTEILESGEGGP
jgi:hypothetical protein